MVKVGNKVGDILKGGDIVYGIVEIDATNKQIYDYNYENEYYLGYFNHDYIGRNIQLHEEIKALVPCISKVDNNDIKEDKLYHLLTNTSTFNIDNLRFYDYNSLINLHLGKLFIHLIISLTLNIYFLIIFFKLKKIKFIYDFI